MQNEQLTIELNKSVLSQDMWEIQSGEREVIKWLKNHGDVFGVLRTEPNNDLITHVILHLGQRCTLAHIQIICSDAQVSLEDLYNFEGDEVITYFPDDQMVYRNDIIGLASWIEYNRNKIITPTELQTVLLEYGFLAQESLCPKQFVIF